MVPNVDPFKKVFDTLTVIVQQIDNVQRRQGSRRDEQLFFFFNLTNSAQTFPLSFLRACFAINQVLFLSFFLVFNKVSVYLKKAPTNSRVSNKRAAFTYIPWNVKMKNSVKWNSKINFRNLILKSHEEYLKGLLSINLNTQHVNGKTLTSDSAVYVWSLL